jgi:fermentation-respiration switch protein FrsA (DUF1100 family)
MENLNNLSPFVLILVAPLIIYLALLLLLYLNQSSMIFVPSRQINLTPKTVGLEFESVQFVTPDRVKLSAWFIPSSKPDSYVILQCHGNGGNISNRVDYSLIFYQMGLSSLQFDYRGYGNSEGSPDEAGLYLDALTAWEYLVDERQISPHKIIVYGESLGGGVASYLATQKPIGGLILASTFTSVPDRAAELYPFFPIHSLSSYQFNTYDRLPQIKVPILVIHSREDVIIPFSHGEKNFARANEPKTFLEIKGDHNYGFLESGTIYSQGILDFIAKIDAGNEGRY